jgi:hypothetical protein
MRKSNPAIELIPSPSAIVRTSISEAELNRLVQQKVAEIMAERDATVFEPFFRSRQIAYELKRLQTVPEQRNWSVYFERCGCLICETRKSIHAGNGMCNTCHARTFQTLKHIVGEIVRGQEARPAAGSARSERLLPETAPARDVHRTWLKRRTRNTKQLGA